MGVIILCATPFNSFSIWLWIYIFHGPDVQRTNSLKVESFYNMILVTLLLLLGVNAPLS